ncbi:hypothetical protein, partial [Streptomyces europaeiscabiei]|uniref:hypothetical protein n=1 Tax=Streptomyces europaeiscabiei TaxID=146819 RepID=UPI0038F7AF82
VACSLRSSDLGLPGRKVRPCLVESPQCAISDTHDAEPVVLRAQASIRLPERLSYAGHVEVVKERSDLARIVEL